MRPEEPTCSCFPPDKPSPSTHSAISLCPPIRQTTPAWLFLKFTSSSCGKTVHLERVWKALGFHRNPETGPISLPLCFPSTLSVLSTTPRLVTVQQAYEPHISFKYQCAWSRDMRAGEWEQTEQASIACQVTLMNFNTGSHCLRRAGERRQSYSKKPLQEQSAFFQSPLC